MAELFSSEWAEAYMKAWNADEMITSTLEHAGFNSVVAFGYPDAAEPAFIMKIQMGKIVAINSLSAADAEWDIRATLDNWLALIVKPPGLMKLGIAYTSRKLRFTKGDYATMVRDPSLAEAFVKSFGLMGKIL